MIEVTNGGKPLSNREREILALVAEGLQEPDIANRLFIARGTVNNAKAGIFAKLGAANSAHAVALAMRAGELL